MKRKLLLSLSIGFAAIAILNSNSSGPASNNNGNRTGSPTAAGTCTGCHGGGPAGTTMTITLKKKSDNSPVTNQYNAGAFYVVRISGTHPSLGGFGFQLAAIKSGNTQAGTFSNFGSNYHATRRNGIDLVEQHHTLSKTGNDFVAEFDWQAPPSGTGTVNFYGVLNAVNGDGNITGDAVSNSVNVTLTESTTNVESVEKSNLNIYPNPVTDMLKVDMGGSAMGNYTYAITDLNGKRVAQNTVAVNASVVNIPVETLQKGIYTLTIMKGAEKHTQNFIKQ